MAEHNLFVLAGRYQINCFSLEFIARHLFTFAALSTAAHVDVIYEGRRVVSMALQGPGYRVTQCAILS